MEDDIFADVKQETEPLDTDIVEKTTPESQPENKQTEKPSQKGENTSDESEEDKLPFHRHPRWIAQRKRLEADEAELKELREFREKAEPFLKEKESTEVKLPDWWASAYGDTPESQEQYRVYLDITKAEREKMKTELKEELRGELTAEETSKKEANDYVLNEVESMKSEGLKFEEQKLFTFIKDYVGKYGPTRLLDAEGNYDMRYCLDLMGQMTPQPQNKTTEIKKRIADDGHSRGYNKPDLPIINPSTLRRGNWRDYNN